ncbi:hypothetical protein ACFU6I_41560 [Streptomyces sp. NPDC057486]|uniref:hypothetical protein n=1 Tax=Streptomyces sp. NPDC057486 TaxID=3346145 RepID=UPI0036ADC929
MTESGEVREPLWLIAANVVRFRRYGEGGQELRPGTKSFRGGSKVYVIGGYGGMAYEEVTVIGRGRHTGAYITIDMATRNLHSFRPALVRSPAVLRRYDEAPGGWYGDETREASEAMATLLAVKARAERTEHWRGSPHPDPCRCHECLTLTPE